MKETGMPSKGEIRRQVLAVRDRIPPEEKACLDGKIRERILAHPAYLEAQLILAYANYRSEADTTLLIRRALQDGKHVFVPRVEGAEMEFWFITSSEDLRSGYRGIPEPVRRISLPEWLTRNGGSAKTVLPTAMLWMPGAVFDTQRHRIGYGKGFYDRYLSRLSDGRERKPNGTVGFRLRLTVAALAYSCQVLRQIPYEPHDVRPDMVITENECF